MAGKNINQIATQATTIDDTDKFYLGRSPFGVTDDRWISGADLKTSTGAVTPAEVQDQTFTFDQTDSGILDNYVVALTPAIVSYVDGLTFSFIPANTNISSTPTIDAGAGPITIVDIHGNPLAPGSIKALIPSTVKYYNGQFFLQGESGVSAVTPQDIQNEAFTYANDTGVADAYVVALNPTPDTNIKNVIMMPANSNLTGSPTLDVGNGAGPLPIVSFSFNSPAPNDIFAGVPAILQFNPSANNWSLLNPVFSTVTPQAVQTNTYIYANDTGVADAYLATFTPAIGSYSPSYVFLVQIAHNNLTTTPTIDFGLGALNIVTYNGSAVSPGDLAANNVSIFMIDSTTTKALLMNPLVTGSGTVNPGNVNEIAYYAATGSVVSGLATANDGLLVTNNTGVPSILAGPGTTGNILQSNAALAPSFSPYTFPVTAGSAGSIVISDGSNKINSTSLWPNTVGSVGKIIRSDGTVNAYSTATFADTYGASTILYSNGANTVTGLATANSSVLVTTSAGVPVQSGTMANGNLIIGSTGATPVVASLTAGTNISITPGAGSITIATSVSSAPITQVNAQRITATGAFTYTPTSGTKYIICTIVGAGGGGGGASGALNQSAAGGGGGSAGAVQFLMTAAQIGVSLSGSVGTGGAGGANTGGNGGNGGDTTFGDWTAGHGAGGLGCVASASSQYISGGGGTGNTFGTGTVISSFSASTGMNGSTLTNIFAISGAGGSCGAPGQGVGGVSITTSLANALGTLGGAGRGAGGAGAVTLDSAVGAVGGAGGNGTVFIVEYISV